MALLSVKNLSVYFGDFTALHNLSFEVEDGDVAAIIGPNGAGKTVLFRALLGLVPYEGEIRWSKPVRIGYVPQRFAVARDVPLTVMEFLKFKKTPEKEIYEALREVGFLSGHDEHHWRHHLLNAKLGELSGGELQRVLIAYALVNHPDVLLFDEPTAGVDIGGEETIYLLLEKLGERRGLTILLITHELHVIYKHTDKVLCLNREKFCYGAPKNILTPHTLEEIYGTEISVYEHGQHHH